MKTSDETKRGLECYGFGRTDGCDDCDKCPLNTDYMGHESLMQDALAYIQQLERQNAEQAARLEQVTRERDAAVGDLTNVYKDSCCAVCANKTDDGCALRFYECIFEWRGVPQEAERE